MRIRRFCEARAIVCVIRIRIRAILNNVHHLGRRTSHLRCATTAPIYLSHAQTYTHKTDAEQSAIDVDAKHVLYIKCIHFNIAAL